MSRIDAGRSDPRIALFAGRMRELLELLAALRELDGALTTPEGLRRALSVAERLASLIGADEAWLGWLRRLAADEALLAIAAAIVEYLWQRGSASEPKLYQANEVTTQDWQDWLPLLLELLELLRGWRGSN